MKKTTLKERFFEKIEKSLDPDGCWLWIASKYRDGYGRIQYKRKSRRAHRISWFIHFGEMPEGVCVLHKCDNPLCVRPDHLFLGTPLDNVADMMSKGRQVPPIGERNGSAKLSGYEVEKIRELYVSGGWTYQTLADHFGVDAGTIGQIVRADNWRSLNSPDGYSKSVQTAQRASRARGERMPNSKLTPQDVREIRRLRALGHEIIPLGKQFGVSNVLISLIARRKAWAHIP